MDVWFLGESGRPSFNLETVQRDSNQGSKSTTALWMSTASAAACVAVALLFPKRELKMQETIIMYNTTFEGRFLYTVG